MSNSLSRVGGNGASERPLPWSSFRDLFGFDPFGNVRGSYGFDYDVSRSENGYEIELPVPGFNASHIDVNVKDGILSVAGKSERRSFTRSFTIPEDVNEDGIGAKVQDGMLRLTLQRRPEAQPKKITVTE